MENNSTDQNAVKNADGPQEPEVTVESDFSYFESLQNQPMTTEDTIKFLFLVGFPLVSFIIAVVLMHVYND